MADNSTTKPATLPVVNVPGMGQIQVAVIKLPNGQLALRHPSELVKGQAPAPPAGEGA